MNLTCCIALSRPTTPATSNLAEISFLAPELDQQPGGPGKPLRLLISLTPNSRTRGETAQHRDSLRDEKDLGVVLGNFESPADQKEDWGQCLKNILTSFKFPKLAIAELARVHCVAGQAALKSIPMKFLGTGHMPPPFISNNDEGSGKPRLKHARRRVRFGILAIAVRC